MGRALELEGGAIYFERVIFFRKSYHEPVCVCVCVCMCDCICVYLYVVPCYRRCHQMAVIPENEKVIRVDQNDEEGWVDTHHGVGKVCKVVGG